MNNKNIDLFNDSRQNIISNLISELVIDAKPFLTENESIDLVVKGHAARIIYALYDMFLMNSIYQGNNIVSNFDAYESFEYLSQDILTQQVKDFYDAMPKLLNESFTLNNDFYFTDLRCFIVDLEDSLRQESQGK
jgi:hypothetical protein